MYMKPTTFGIQEELHFLDTKFCIQNDEIASICLQVFVMCYKYLLTNRLKGQHYVNKVKGQSIFTMVWNTHTVNSCIQLPLE